MRLPDFLIIGSQKVGTTSLDDVLQCHPEVGMYRPKDQHFFTRDDLYRQGIARYAEGFAHVKPGARVLGESSVSYVCHPAGRDRIHAHLPDGRFVLTVRNPIDRAYSQYWHGRRSLSERRSFDELARDELSEEYEPGRPGHFSRGVYIRYIERWLERFPRESLLVMVFEDLTADPRAFYRSLFTFLGVDPQFECPQMFQRSNPARQWTNPAYRLLFEHPRLAAVLPRAARRAVSRGTLVPWKAPPMRPETRQRLRAFYAEPNRRLAAFLGRPLPWD